MTTTGPVDLLAFGPHPDDIEIGMAATVAKHASLGFRVGLCDLTRGELGSNGTPEERVAEGEAAAALLGAAWRVNLGLPDGALTDTDPHVRAIVDIVRSARPAAIAVPFADDRHPDHRRAAALLASAVFKAGLRRYPAAGAPWHAQWVCAYFINDSAPPSFVVDVSDVYDLKRRALACHASQFDPLPRTPPTRASPRRCSCSSSRAATRNSERRPASGSRRASSVREPVVRPLLTDRWPVAARRP